MRSEFVITQDQMNVLLNASKPVLLIALHCGMPASPQENANNAWQALGLELGFDYMTVEPISGKSQLHFTAELKERVA